MGIQRTKADWEKIIDGTKSGTQLARELKVSPATVYRASRIYNLPLPKASMTDTAYHGIPIEQFKKELQYYTVRDVARLHGLDATLLKYFLQNRGVEVPQNRPRNQPQVVTKPLKRSGLAMEMIRYLTTKFTDSSIANVFGYSKERIRQIRNDIEG